MYVDDVHVAEFEMLPHTNAYRLLLPELGSHPLPLQTHTQPHTFMHTHIIDGTETRSRDTPGVSLGTHAKGHKTAIKD